MGKDALDTASLTGDELVQVLATLGSPQRMRVLGALAGGRAYVAQLVRELDISRTLLQIHLKKLETAGLVTAHVELSDDGRALKFYEVTRFSLHLTPEVMAAAAPTITTAASDGGDQQKGS